MDSKTNNNLCPVTEGLKIIGGYVGHKFRK